MNERALLPANKKRVLIMEMIGSGVLTTVGLILILFGKLPGSDVWGWSLLSAGAIGVIGTILISILDRKIAIQERQLAELKKISPRI